MSLLAGMVAGADSIDDVDRLRHAGNGRVFAEVRAPSRLGTFLRSFTHGHVQQLNAVARQTLVRLAERAPLLGDGQGGDLVVFVDVDPRSPAGLRVRQAGRGGGPGGGQEEAAPAPGDA